MKGGRGPEAITVDEAGAYVAWLKSSGSPHRGAVHGQDRAERHQAPVRHDEKEVVFRCRDGPTGEPRTARVAPHEFIRRSLLHVPPQGFHKVRLFVSRAILAEYCGIEGSQTERVR